MDTFTAIQKFEDQEKLLTNEGRRGVENLCRIVHAMGYRDSQHFGQFHQAGSYGDLIAFLEDNSGCIEAIKDWIAQQDIDDWTDSLKSELDEEICENCGEPLQSFMKEVGMSLDEVYGCPDCDS